MDDLCASGRIEVKAISGDGFVNRDLGENHLEAVLVARAVDADATGVFCKRRRRNIERLPVGIAHIGKQSAFRAIGLETNEAEIGTIKPDLPENLGLVAAPKNGEHIIAS